MTSPIYIFDFTTSAKDHPDGKEIKGWCKKLCKKYTVQGETGDTGYKHWQGRISLIKKRRLNDLIKISKDMEVFQDTHFSITSKGGKGDLFYVMKEDTYDEQMGRFSDTDIEKYIPRQFREIKELYPWQQYIFEHWDDWDTRTINILVDKEGCKGKSTIAGYMEVHERGFSMPACNDIKDLMRIAYDMPSQRCYLIDFPRAMNKDKLFQFYSGIECLKNGKVYDDRYHYKQRWMDCPNIWIFTNKRPDLGLMSMDRWKIWRISDDLNMAICDL